MVKKLTNEIIDMKRSVRDRETKAKGPISLSLKETHRSK
jgi:hypothetical protein